jgi:lysophospholipase L1-like esterase
MNNRIFYSVLLFLFAGIIISNAQDPSRFKEQVDELLNTEYNFSPGKQLVVFTGSSSIRMWKDVQDYFPAYNIINNGFGGSHFSDLLYYYNQLILKPKPEILFIYEGDNDIAGNKNPVKIKRQAKKLYKKIRQDLPATEIIFISPKPSIARENLKKEYEKLNKRLKKYCARKENLEFADVWFPMLGENGNVFQDLFIEDGLHMNKKGYDLWAKVISQHLE